MPTDEEIERTAAALAERTNGGKFNDPAFYAPQHREHWRRIARARLAGGAPRAAPSNSVTGKGGKSMQNARPEKVADSEINEFSSHCVHIRSVYVLGMRIWRDSTAAERKLMQKLAPSFFENFTFVLGDYLVMAASKITDPAIDAKGNENFTVELFVKSFPPDSQDYKDMDAIRSRMENLRAKILPARNKLGAHSDRDVIRKGEALATASWKEWDEFWAALADFIRELNRKRLGHSFEIEAGGVLGDAEMLLKAFKQSEHFETLLNSRDAVVKEASLALAMDEK